MSHEPAAAAEAGDVTAPSGNARALVGVLASVTATGLAWGTLMPLIPVLLERRGVPAALIGVVSVSSTLATIAVTPLLPRILRTLGLLPSVFGSLGLIIVCLMLMPVFTSGVSWFVLRFLIGLGGGFNWVLSEAWVNTAVKPERRGLYLGIYTMLFMIGFVVGPLLLAMLDLESAWPFVVVAIAIFLAGVALYAVRDSLPPIATDRSRSQWRYFTLAPVLFAAVLAAGTVDSGVWALLPIYALQKGSTTAEALLLASIFNAGSVLSQIPLGMLADRMRKRVLLLVLCVIFGAAGGLLPWCYHSAWLLWPLLFIWGSAGSGIYTLALADLGEVFPGTALAGANALFVMCYSLGHLIGPPASGAAMDDFGPDGLPYESFAVMLAFLVFAAALPRR